MFHFNIFDKQIFVICPKILFDIFVPSLTLVKILTAMNRLTIIINIPSSDYYDLQFYIYIIIYYFLLLNMT